MSFAYNAVRLRPFEIAATAAFERSSYSSGAARLRPFEIAATAAAGVRGGRGESGAASGHSKSRRLRPLVAPGSLSSAGARLRPFEIAATAAAPVHKFLRTLEIPVNIERASESGHDAPHRVV